MPRAHANGIELEYQTTGDPTSPPIVIINGFTSQLTAWRDEFCEALAATGLYVIRFDNRDCGLSTHLQGEPDLAALLDGDLSGVVYTLDDMAADVTGLLDALGIPAAHIMGVSMGGMIAQLVAISHPEHVLSLCSIMSTTGAREHFAPDPAAAAALMQAPPTSREQAGEQAVIGARISIAPAYLDEQLIAGLAMADYDRAHDLMGALRQAGAIAAATDRSALLAEVRVPTLVIHGDFDPMIVLAGGEATAAAVPGAELLVIHDMGHFLAEPQWPQIVEAIAANTRRANTRRANTRRPHA